MREQGSELTDVLAAQVHATRTLLNLAELFTRGSPVILRGHQVSVEVRDDEDLVLQASLTWGGEKSMH
jgi:hypothetical protein